MYTIHIILRKEPLRDVYVGVKKTDDYTNVVCIKEAEYSHSYASQIGRLKIPISDEIRESLSGDGKEMFKNSDFIRIKITEEEYNNKYFGPASERTSIAWDVTEEQFNEFFK